MISIKMAILSINLMMSSITLQEAMDKKIVNVSVYNNPNGTHYQDPVIMKIQNLSSSQQSIIIENGRTFTPEDSAKYQPIIIIKKEIIALSPGETKEIKLSGMCFDHEKAGANKDVVYNVSKIATGKLKKLTEYLEQNNLNGYESQHAIWCISNNNELEEIVGWEEEKTNMLIKYVAELTGKPIPPPPSKDNYERNLSVRPNPKTTVGGNFEFELLKETEIHIAMFNEDNIVVRELYFNPAEKKGYHTFNYEFDATIYNEPVYYVRYLENKTVFMEFKLEM